MDIKLSQQIELAAWDIFNDSVSQSSLVKRSTKLVIHFIENKMLLFIFRTFIIFSLTLIFAFLAGFVLSALPI